MRHDVAINNPWERLVGLFRGVEATSWGSLLLGNAWPAYIFALPLSARLWNLAHTRRAETLHDQAQLLQESVTIVFLGLVVVLFAIRRRAIKGQRATWRTGGVALLGTFLLETGSGRDQRFWRLAQALSALYPKSSDEKRWVDGVLGRKKALGF